MTTKTFISAPTCAVHDYRCPGCFGRGTVVAGRTQVKHKSLCPLFTRLKVKHPDLMEMIQVYRQDKKENRT